MMLLLLLRREVDWIGVTSPSQGGIGQRYMIENFYDGVDDADDEELRIDSCCPPTRESSPGGTRRMGAKDSKRHIQCGLELQPWSTCSLVISIFVATDVGKGYAHQAVRRTAGK